MPPFTDDEVDNWIKVYDQTTKENKPGTDKHRIAAKLLKEFKKLRELRKSKEANPFGTSPEGIG